MYILWQFDVLKNSPGLEPSSEGHYGFQDDRRRMPRVKLKAEFSSQDLYINALGYAEAAIGSYKSFALLKREGVIPQHLRFQVSLPTPLAPVISFVAPEDRPLVEPAYEKAMLKEISDILKAIPHEDLAIQWDVSREMAVIEGALEPHFDEPEKGISERLLRLASAVPEEVEIGYHLCYGDFQHRHFMEPKDSENLTKMANAISANVHRSINWIHFPVPRDRDDLSYFAPLRGLELHPETELYAGLIHHTDGVEGTRKRMAAAGQVLKDFGVGTECGWGRRPHETLLELIRIHHEIANSVV
ncbi:MAG: hypothetical protein C1O27_002372 [Chloroflexi bacterium]|nr:MAG: hypothetical protein C1O27_002372 [Chloroflexota bacterium]